jgi:hypothetical protein
MAERARELGLDPGDPKVREQLLNQIKQVFTEAEEVRRGVSRSQGQVEPKVLFCSLEKERTLLSQQNEEMSSRC